MIVLSICIAVIFVSGYAGWKDFLAYKKVSRIGLIVFSGLMLIGFIAEPKWWPSTTGDVALLTPGVNVETFNTNKYDSVFSIREDDKGSTKINWLSAVSILQGRLQEGSLVEMHGYGTEGVLPKAFQWKNNLSKPKKGMVLHRAPKTIETGRLFSFSISISGAESGDSLFVFRDGALWDSQEIGENSHFDFKDRLLMEGPTSYVFEWSEGGEVISESWNVRAVKPRLLTVGTLLFSPSFEVNYLLEHLGERGHSVISRVRIGEELFRYDVINASSDQAEDILDQLSDLDVLFLDSREFESLSDVQQLQVKESVNNGLDVILTPANTDDFEVWNSVFSELADEDIQTESLNRLEERNWLPESFQPENTLQNPIPLLNLTFENISESGDKLFRYADSEPVAVRFQKNNGSISGHLFYRTYNWLIEGEQQAYNRFWVEYLNKAVVLEGGAIEVAPVIPKVDEEVEVYITQPETFEEIAVKSVFESETLKLPLVQELKNQEVYSSSFWPAKAGWHVVESGQQKWWFYVYSENEWKFDESIKAYRQTVNKIEKAIADGKNFEDEETSKIPDWIWLIAFLTFQTILWIERKIIG